MTRAFYFYILSLKKENGAVSNKWKLPFVILHSSCGALFNNLPKNPQKLTCIQDKFEFRGLYNFFSSKTIKY